MLEAVAGKIKAESIRNISVMSSLISISKLSQKRCVDGTEGEGTERY